MDGKQNNFKQFCSQKTPTSDAVENSHKNISPYGIRVGKRIKK